jgi:hypothetical protein
VSAVHVLLAGFVRERQASWVVGASSDKHLMAVACGRLGDGIDNEPIESRLILVRLELLC